MGIITPNGFCIPFQTDARQLELTCKTRVERECRICQKKIPKGSICLGKRRSWYSYGNVCLNCGYKFLNIFIESIEEFKKLGELTLKDITKNRKKYQAQNTMARI